MKYLISLLNIMTAICKWLSIVVAVLIFTSMIRVKKSRKLTVKEWCVLILSALYAVLFIGLLVINPEVHNDVFTSLSLLAMFISYVWEKYVDRRNGTRWWNW